MPLGPETCQEFPDFQSCVDALVEEGNTEEEARRICGAWERDCNSRNQISLATEQVQVDNFFVLVRRDGQLIAIDLGSDEPPETRRDREADGFAIVREFKDGTNRASTTRRPLVEVVERARRIVEEDQGQELRLVIVGRAQQKRLASGEHKGRILYRDITGIRFRRESSQLQTQPWQVIQMKNHGRVSKDVIEGETVEQAKHQRRDTARTPEFSGTETREDQPWGDVDKSLSAFIEGLLDDADPDTDWSDLSQSQRRRLASRTLLGNPDAETASDGLSFPVVNPSNDNLNEGALFAAKSAAGGGRGAELEPESAESIVSVTNRLLEDEFGHEIDQSADMENATIFVKGSEDVMDGEEATQSESTEEPEDDELIEDSEQILSTIQERSYPCSPTGRPIYSDGHTIVQRVNSRQMSADFVIVTRGKEPNRHGAKVQIVPSQSGQGMLTENFRRNPVVLFGHGMEPSFPLPLGTARDPDNGQVVLNRSRNRMTSTVFFSQHIRESEIVFALVDEGVLNAASVQFMPFKAKRLKVDTDAVDLDGDDDVVTFNPTFPFDFVESDLWEWSLVPLPADPGALRKSIDRGSINGVKIPQSVCQGLAKYAEQPKVWSPGVQLTTPYSVTYTLGEATETVTFRTKNELDDFLSRRQSRTEVDKSVESLETSESQNGVDTDCEPHETRAQRRKRMAQQIRERRANRHPRIQKEALASVFQETVKPAQQQLGELVTRQYNLERRVTRLSGK